MVPIASIGTWRRLRRRRHNSCPELTTACERGVDILPTPATRGGVGEFWLRSAVYQLTGRVVWVQNSTAGVSQKQVRVRSDPISRRENF